MKILPHLKPGGHWIELCYPQQRWIREGRLPFTEWGKVTDGERTPWVECFGFIVGLGVYERTRSRGGNEPTSPVVNSLAGAANIIELIRPWPIRR